MCVNPIGKNAPCSAAAPKLPRAGQHSAAIDPHRKIKSVAVLQGHRFRRQFGAAVQGNRSRHRECFGDALGAHTRRQRLRRIENETPAFGSQRQAGQRGEGVHPAAAQQDKTGLVPLAILEQVRRSVQVVLNQLTAARPPVDARQHARVGRGVDHPIGRRQGFQIRRHARIAMKDLDAQRAQIAAVSSARRAAEDYPRRRCEPPRWRSETCARATLRQTRKFPQSVCAFNDYYSLSD